MLLSNGDRVESNYSFTVWNEMFILHIFIGLRRYSQSCSIQNSALEFNPRNKF